MRKKIKYPEGGYTGAPKQASLYQRLLDKGIITNTMTEAQFGALPKEQIDAYFQAYGKAIGAKTQAEVDAMPGTKTYLQPTIFTGAQEKTTTTFDDAFAEARKAGLSTFEYNGKSYNTQLDPNYKPTGSSNTTTETKSDLMMNIAGKEFAMGGRVRYPDGGETKTKGSVTRQHMTKEQIDAIYANSQSTMNDPKLSEKNAAGDTIIHDWNGAEYNLTNFSVDDLKDRYSKLTKKQKAWGTDASIEGKIKILEDEFKKRGVTYADGGHPQYDAITGALSPFISMIPGGQFINMGLSVVGSLLPEKKEEPAPYVGPYAMGGRVKYAGGGPTYEVEGNEVVLGNSMLEGSSDESEAGSIAKGPTHANGGVDASGGNYVLSDRIGVDGSYGVKNPNSIASHARPIIKAFSKMNRRTFDVVDRNAEKIMSSKLEMLKQINEAELKVREASQKFANGGIPKFWGGGDPPDAPMTLDEFMQDPVANSQLAADAGYTYAPQEGVNLIPAEYTQNAYKEMADPNTFSTKDGKLPGTTTNPTTTTGKISSGNTLDYLGMGIAALGTGAELLNTIKEHNSSLPNENFYEDVSARAERTYNDSLNTLNAQKSKSARDINDSYGSLFFGQQGNSINVDRAMKNVGYVNRAKNIGDSNLAYDSAIADRKVGLSNLQMQGDTLQAQGAFQTRTADQQDLANYFTNLGVNISDATGQALNAVKIAQNAKSQTQALNMLSQAYPNFTLQELQGMLQIIFKG